MPEDDLEFAQNEGCLLFAVVGLVGLLLIVGAVGAAIYWLW